MNGKEILADTNILLYLLKRNDTLEKLLQHKIIYLSFITELEMIGFSQTTVEEDAQIQSLLEECIILPMNNNIKEKYCKLRKESRLKLADAVIAATAMTTNLPLITADKQFRIVTDLNVILYEV